MRLTTGTPAFRRNKKAKKNMAASALDDEMAYQVFMA